MTLEFARSAAMADLDIVRARQTRAAGIKRLNAELGKWPSTVRAMADPRREILLALTRLNRIDRYEQRAAWARNKALRRIWAADGTHELVVSKEEPLTSEGANMQGRSDRLSSIL